jgi:HK97 family phage major capsid protein
MAKQTLRQELMSEQDRGYAGLLNDVLDKIDERFSELDEATQKKFLGAAGEIAKLRDDVRAANDNHAQRYAILASDYQRGGAYKGPFRDAEQAATFGKFVAAVAGGPHAMAALKSDRDFASINPTTGISGGFAMPEQLLAGIINNTEKYGVFERNVRSWPADSETVSRVKRVQGATVYYPDLGVACAESVLKLGSERAGLTRHAVLALIDRWMLNTASPGLQMALGDYVAEEFGLALALATDRNAFIGDGTPTYAKTTGLLKLSGSLDVTGDAGDDTFQELINKTTYYLSKLIGALPDVADDENCKFYMHRSIFWGYLGIRDDQGRPIADILTASGRPQRFLLGYPVEVTQVAPKLADTAISTNLLVLANLMRGAELYRNRGGAELRIGSEIRMIEGQVVMLLECLQGVKHLDETVSVRLKTHA